MLYLETFACGVSTVSWLLESLRLHSVVAPGETPELVETGGDFTPTRTSRARSTDVPITTGVCRCSVPANHWDCQHSIPPLGVFLVLFDADEYLARPIQSEWRWGNTISITSPIVPAADQAVGHALEGLAMRAVAERRVPYATVATASEWQDRHQSRQVRSLTPVASTSHLIRHRCSGSLSWGRGAS